jgi:type I protein arginine methyltransferase
VGNTLGEHHDYISDRNRSEKFEQAIARAVRPGDSVVDVGCGFGILGLMCLKAGAAHVWGIDRTEAIEVARETIRRAGFADRYTCLHESSFRAELPQQVDMVICDHVGHFGFDYGIVEVLADARRRFLKPGGKVLPARIVLQVAAVRSAACRAKAEAWSAEPIPEEYRWLREYGVNIRHSYDFTADEIASAASELGTIDLREDCPDSFSFCASLTIDRAGELDGLAGWFACEIAEDVWMTNSPLAEDKLQRAQVFLPFGDPLSVGAGDTVEVTISARHENALITWSARVARTGQTVRQSTWKSTILHPADKVPDAERIPRLSELGAARKTVLAQIDGRATLAQIEQAVLEAHPTLFPSTGEIERFVRTELQRSSS